MVTEPAKLDADMATYEAPILPSKGLRLRALPRQPDDEPGQRQRWHGQHEGGPLAAIEPVTRNPTPTPTSPPVKTYP